MEFEYDPSKSEKNKIKHGIDFNEAQIIWKDPDRIVIPAKTTDEPRHVIIGKIAGRLWSAIFTNRNTGIRIISVRRARKEEIKLYEG